MGTIANRYALSELEAWSLFEKLAFEPGQSPLIPHLVKIVGKGLSHTNGLKMV